MDKVEKKILLVESLFKKLETESEIKDYILLDEFIHFTPQNYRRNCLIFKNIEFWGDVKFSRVDFGFGLKFIECKFHGVIFFEESKASGYHPDFNENYNVCFEKCEGSDLFFLTNNFERGIEIRGNCSIANIEIKHFTATYAGITILSSSSKRVYIAESKIQRLKFNETNISREFLVTGIEAEDISILKSELFANIQLSSSLSTNILINGCIFKNAFYLVNIKVIDSLFITENEFKKRVFLGNSKDESSRIGGLEISSCAFSDLFQADGDNYKIRALKVYFSQSLSGNVFFNNCDIEEASLIGDNNSAALSFDKCNFKILDIANFNNYSTLRLASCEALDESSEIKITNSNLGKASFFSVGLDKFKKVSVINSHLGDILASGVRWFKDSNLHSSTDKESQLETSYRRREIYRQLKFASEKQSDRIQALEFKARELSAYKNELKLKNYPWYHMDRINLWFSQSNDFGLNWGRPIRITLIVTLIVYVILTLLGSTRLEFEPASSINDLKVTFCELWNHIYILPQLFNPTRVTERVFPEEHFNLNFGVYLLDVFHRIFLAIFIYQIISAFRKYVK